MHLKPESCFFEDKGEALVPEKSPGQTMSVKYGQFDIPTFVHPFLEKVSGKLPAI
jgi:hypothetical protein